MIPIYVLTNDKHLHLLRGFSYLWNEFYPNRDQQVMIAGFSQPSFELPDNFAFLSLGEQAPKERWSNSLIDLCNYTQQNYFILMLEDYWLIDHVNIGAINYLMKWMDDDVLRLDLSGNRTNKPHKNIGYILDGQPLDVIESLPSAKYQMSFQAAIWNKKNLLKVLRPNENPWESEINGSERVGSLRVIGTKQKIMKYQPVWRSQQKRWQLDKIPGHCMDKIRREGWLNA